MGEQLQPDTLSATLAEFDRRLRTLESTRRGGGGGGIRRVSTQITFDTADLTDGVVVYTPVDGDVLVDVWLELTEAWDGATPQADIGTFTGATTGLFFWVNLPVTLDDPNNVAVELWGDGFLAPNLATIGVDFARLNNASNWQLVPGRFTGTDTLKVVVSQDGEAGGADPGAAQGAMTVHVFVSGPT